MKPHRNYLFHHECESLLWYALVTGDKQPHSHNSAVTYTLFIITEVNEISVWQTIVLVGDCTLMNNQNQRHKDKRNAESFSRRTTEHLIGNESSRKKNP